MSWGQVYSGAQSREIWNSMGGVILRARPGDHPDHPQTAMLERKGSFLYRKGIHLLDVRESVDHLGWLVVTVQSAPDLPTSITDFGRGHGINSELLGSVAGIPQPDDAELTLG
jgi:hypothetical protein